MEKSFILFTIFLLTLKWKSYSQTADPEEICNGAQDSCSSCLLANPLCGWCADNVTSSSARCQLASITNLQCQEGFAQTPESNVSFPRNEAFTLVESYEQGVIDNLDLVQLRPQGVDVKLRQGDTRVVNITFRRVTDYPLDLYYVMDLSNSMKDDLETLQRLGISLASDILEVTPNLRLGFGTFVDKPMMPYASTVPELLQDPCLRQNESCAPVFGFRHQLALTDDYTSFELEVNKTRISGNIDSPEGGFDALMQIAVCQEQIRWREDALRVVIFTTDASSHIAMDGKLAAILEANDMQCHLERQSNGAYIYTESQLLDYPSIGQLKRVFEANKIQSIFAVTEDVQPVYEDLQNLLGASVRILNNDSSNIREIIQSQYDLLRTRIQLAVPSVPSNINVTYRSLCPNGNETTWVPNSLECDTVRIGDEVVFQFNLTATGCPQNPNQIDMFNITSSSILEQVAVSVEYVSCQCECAEDRMEGSSRCSNAGAFECGLCYCNAGSTGQQCQCDALTSGEAVESQCTRDPSNFGPDSELCSNVGTCECGVCACNEGFSGTLCECTRNGCPNDCGGMERGTCNNCNGDQRCMCNANRGWTFNPRQGDCSCNDMLCRAPNSTIVCSGRGTCDCNTCRCESFRSGRYCNRCEHPQCTDIEDGCNGAALRECAECVYENNRQDRTVASECETVCTDRNILYEYEETILDCGSTTCNANCDRCTYLSPNRTVHVPQVCTTTHPVTECDVTYKIFWDANQFAFVVYVQEHNAERDCPGPVDPLLIVLPVVGGIVLLGLIALILWKIFQTIRDKHEYEQFLEEAKRSQWKTNENPLFEKPTDRIENPAYIGAN